MAVEYLDKIFKVIEKTPHHTYQVLKKRAERMFRYLFQRQIPKRIKFDLAIKIPLYINTKAERKFFRLFVVPPGIEPGTHGFSVRCSTN